MTKVSDNFRICRYMCLEVPMSVSVLSESYLARFLLILQTSPPLFLQFFAVFAIAIFGRLLIPVSSTRHFNTLDLLRCPSEISLKLLEVCCLLSSRKEGLRPTLQYNSDSLDEESGRRLLAGESVQNLVFEFLCSFSSHSD